MKVMQIVSMNGADEVMAEVQAMVGVKEIRVDAWYGGQPHPMAADSIASAHTQSAGHVNLSRLHNLR